LTAKHCDSFWISATRALINEQRQIFATRGRKLKTVLNERSAQKKEQGIEPCSKNCVDPIFPLNLNLILLAG
jgi:hypothetical protein